MARRPLPLLLLLALVLGGLPARASADQDRYLVLVVPGFERDRGLAENASELVIARLAQEGLESIGPEGLTRDFPDLSSLRRCAMQVPCLSRAASALGVTRVLLGLMGAADERVTITLEVIDVVERSSLARRSSTVAVGGMAAPLLELAGQLVADLSSSGGADAARLLLQLQGGEAERILLDGELRGKGSRWESPPLEPGSHELVLVLVGGERVERRLDLEPGQQEVVVRVGAAAAPYEGSLHRGEVALAEGRADEALALAERAIEEGGDGDGAVHLLAARACVLVLQSRWASPSHLVRAFRATRRAAELKVGAPLLEVRAELAKRYAEVRLEPGTDWQQGGRLELEVVEGTVTTAPSGFVTGLVEDAEARAWTLPDHIVLPRPGRYRINRRDLLVSSMPESRSLVLTLPPAPAVSAGGWSTASLSLLGAGGLEAGSELYGGVAGTWYALPLGSGVALARAELVARLADPEDRSVGERLWLTVGPGYGLSFVGGRLCVEGLVGALVVPGGPGFGLTVAVSATWRVLPSLRVGLRPAGYLHDFDPGHTVAGLQLELVYDL